MDIEYQNTILNLDQTSTALTKVYRRNGKLQSCEPCRLSKLRCDHVLPACGRCVKRHRVDKCIYHPAPLSVKRRSGMPAVLTPPLSSLGSVRNTVESVEDVVATPQIQHAGPEPDQSFSASLVASRRQRAASAPIELDERRQSKIKGTPGFLGSTAYAAVFEDEDTHLKLPTRELQLQNDTENTLPIPTEKILTGSKVLSIFQDSFFINHWISKWQELCDYSGEVVILPIMNHWLREMWLHHRETLRDQKPDRIRRLCEQIWKNTQSSLEFDAAISPKDWASLSTGHNLRWEVLGLILSEIGLVAQCISPQDDMFKNFGATRESLSNRMHEAAQTCLSFCRDCEIREDLFQWLLNELCTLTSSLKGPSNFTVYSQNGELINLMIATGFQTRIKADPKTPFFLAELRKRHRISCYGQELATASLLGRPPRLSHRYTSLELPLELSDNDIYTESEHLVPILAKLDADGWSRDQKWQRITYMRANMTHAMRREDVIDIALGNYTKEETLELTDKLRRRYDLQWAKIPAHIRAARDVPSKREQKLAIALYHNVVRHGYLTNELLLQQALVRKIGISGGELVRIARLVFKDIMTITGRRDILKDFRLDLAWILASHGLRCAAILAVELYRQEQLPTYPADPILPRAETIRELSIFVERMADIGPTDGMYTFCEQGRRAISNILDKILAPPRPAVAPNVLVGTAGLTSDVNAFSDATPNAFQNFEFGPFDPSLNFGNDTEFMQWLDNMDWQR